MKHYLFTYATLRNQHIIQKVVGNKISYIGPYILKNFIKIQDSFSTVVPSEGNQVVGALYELTPEQLQKLDNWESHYIRHVLSQDNDKIIYIYLKDEKNERTKNNT